MNMRFAPLCIAGVMPPIEELRVVWLNLLPVEALRFVASVGLCKLSPMPPERCAVKRSTGHTHTHRQRTTPRHTYEGLTQTNSPLVRCFLSFVSWPVWGCANSVRCHPSGALQTDQQVTHTHTNSEQHPRHPQGK